MNIYLARLYVVLKYKCSCQITNRIPKFKLLYQMVPRHFPPTTFQPNNICVEIFKFRKNNGFLKRISIKKIINIYLVGKIVI